MKLQAIFFLLVSLLVLSVSLSAQEISREIVDEECVLLAVRTKGVLQTTHENSALYESPKFFPMGIPRMNDIASSLSDKNVFDSQGYSVNSKFFIFIAPQEHLKEFYEKEGGNLKADSVNLIGSWEDFRLFSDSLGKISKNVFYLADQDLSVEFVVVRARWVKYKVRKKPLILSTVTRRELVLPFYELYFPQHIYEIYSLGGISDQKVRVLRK